VWRPAVGQSGDLPRARPDSCDSRDPRPRRDVLPVWLPSAEGTRQTRRHLLSELQEREEPQPRPRGFYLGYGFTDTGRVMWGENVLALGLAARG
jgi:hypothetical protein